MFQKSLIKFLFFSLLLTFPLILFAKNVKNKRVNFGSKKILAVSPQQNEMLVIGALKSLYTAQATYFMINSYHQFGNNLQLRAKNLIDEHLTNGDKFGYYFSIQIFSGLVPRFSVYARPKSYLKTGKRSFYIDASCQIRGGDKNGADANSNDQVIESCTPTLAYENERLTITGLRIIASAQETFKATIGNGNYSPNLPSLTAYYLLDPCLGAGYCYNHNFFMETINMTPTTPAVFKTWGTPVAYGQLGFRSFYIDNTGVIRGADHQGGRANENDPPIEESKE